MTKSRLLIDTDPGVDDALAILMAHAHADVVGLSIAAGNVGLGHTVGNALKLVDVIGAQTPVFAGCPVPLVLPAADAGFVHGVDGFGDVGYLPSARQAAAEHAANAIVRLAREHAGRLTLIALGPLTNLALALRLDPELPSRVARLVVMGGAVTGRGNTHLVPAEFNTGFDPEAAHIVFSGWPQFDLVDWEACVRHAIPFASFDRMLAAGDARAQFYAAISRKARAFNESHERAGMIIADALAMAVALEPGIVTRAERHHVGVELAGALTRGATVVDWEDRLGRPANARIVLEVEQAHFEALAAAALGAHKSDAPG
ncbi:MAG: nucleoside hydrolase [Rhodanobacteraceae bacterium]|jgi:purine nucleosidase|nr:nucleoside hydrolase [Rhodanobacteraceae bacterium]